MKNRWFKAQIPYVRHQDTGIVVTRNGFCLARGSYPLPKPIPSFCPSITHFRRQFLRHMWSFLFVFIPLSYVGYSFRPWHYVVLLNFLQIRTK